LSGGAAPSSSGLLVKVQELRAIEKDIAQHKAEHDKVKAELATAQRAIDEFKRDTRELNLKKHEVGLLEEQVNGSNATKVGVLVVRLRQSLTPDHCRSCSRQAASGSAQGDHYGGKGETASRIGRVQALGEGNERLQEQQGLEAEGDQGA
jgi:hypothetical protein